MGKNNNLRHIRCIRLSSSFALRRRKGKRSRPFRCCPYIKVSVRLLATNPENASTPDHGDFNDTPENASITQILSAGKISENPESDKLYNLFADPHVLNNPGTHKYQGEWNQLDHIVVSGNLIDKNSLMHVVPGSNRIFMPPFLLTDDKTWHGKRPFRTYYGFKYEGGYSDHLPLITDFLLSLPNKD
ncbi:hypothetical protein [Parabacteroides sp. AM58-2XD]|uniref:endonuclease/exonuclease/phosphatase family protein n=1 Tax=Parabacteroides sp. AM58-2XD TaxID=2292362 RepID=UPI002102CD3E|nr:hypothetical protein [Parabacteroides sp. AM58-2XD]